MSKEPPKEDDVPEMVPWDDIRKAHDNMTMAEKALIRKCFFQHVAGNDYDEDMRVHQKWKVCLVFSKQDGYFIKLFAKGW